MKDEKDNLLVGLDIGTTGVRCFIGEQIEVDKQIQFKILGHGQAKNKGIQSGMITSSDEVIEAVIEAVKSAETGANYKIKSVSVNINGNHIKTSLCEADVKVTSNKKIISDLECNSVEDRARQKATKDKKGLSLIQFFANKYIINQFEEVANPIGLPAETLDIEALGVIASTLQIEMLFQICDQIPVSVNDFSVSSMAVAQATYNRQNWESGVIIIDIGYATTNIAVIKDNKIESVKVLNLGSFHATQDIAILMKADLDVAEYLKLNHAKLNHFSRGTKTVTFKDQTINFSPSMLSQIVTARWEEFCDILINFLETSGYKYLSGGIILAGGGSKMPGLKEMLQTKSEMYTRFGQLTNFSEIPQQIQDDPIYLTAAGLMVIDSGLQTVSRDNLLDNNRSSKNWFKIFK